MGILLAGKAVGSHVIRFSGLQPGFFTITTLASKDNIQSFRIRSTPSPHLPVGRHSPGRGYWLKEDQVFPTLKKLVKTYQATLGLLAPLTGSKYRQLLVEFREGERDNVYDGGGGPVEQQGEEEGKEEGKGEEGEEGAQGGPVEQQGEGEGQAEEEGGEGEGQEGEEQGDKPAEEQQEANKQPGRLVMEEEVFLYLHRYLPSIYTWVVPRVYL
ncbi:uncharacterized protein ACA1_100770 [Acanthamoeba castellanii str. Neff]|uniref:SH2 domain-containing protein n=1 Tax=Acanthamoeba castellanii (strain ATCC 30010 / Neff) TaxID=1257118 RepID=L8GIQ7_ACACF|nr:uncharacterized protein ACA1_100770 [Acanthamoeba castellanii str. Neff]ELR12056.1 hypothetical protein ACA1_100770 [Acanthamoeba castellanii str. Neff]